MKLATLNTGNDGTAVVVLESGQSLDIAAAGASISGSAGAALSAGSVQSVIEGGADAMTALSDLVSRAEAGGMSEYLLNEAPLKAPIPVPLKNVFCVGRNYSEHIKEGEKAQKTKIGVTDHPVFFTKPPTAIVPPGGDVLVFPQVSEAIDYEVELAVVIGTAGRNIPPERAMDHVFGYTILNDITARDIQRRHGGQYFKGKGLDASCPVGPWIVTADELTDPHDLSISLSVNGETRQDGWTSDMIFDIPTIISSLSQGMTLEPGDIIATGTPSGVGYAMEPPQFLKPGDTVRCEISGIGVLTNSVRAA